MADDGVHYGWVAVERDYGIWLDAFAWGYETEAGTPIQAGAVPAPGTLAALVFGGGRVVAAAQASAGVSGGSRAEPMSDAI